MCQARSTAMALTQRWKCLSNIIYALKHYEETGEILL